MFGLLEMALTGDAAAAFLPPCTTVYTTTGNTFHLRHSIQVRFTESYNCLRQSIKVPGHVFPTDPDVY